jgi:hypothetical protein
LINQLDVAMAIHLKEQPRDSPAILNHHRH